MPAPAPSTSRRGVLALAAAALAGTSGCTAVPNGPLPSTAVRLRTRHLSTPTVDRTVPVLESHVDAYRNRLETTVPRARQLWEAVDPDDLSDVPPYTREDVEEARAFLDSLHEKPRTADTVETAMWRVEQAAGAAAYAVVLDGSFDAERLYRAAEETLETFDSLTPTHACVDPERYLPYARRIDHRRWWGRREAAAVVPGTEVQSGADRSTPEGMASLAGQHAKAQARLLDVRQYRAVARKHPLGSRGSGGERRPFAAALTRNLETLTARLDPLVDRFETFEEEHEAYPDSFANGVWGRGMRGRNETREGAYRAANGYPAFGAAKVAAGLVHSHAFVDALETLDPQSPPDAAMVFDEKRAARQALRDRLESTPSPFVRDHLHHALAAVESGDLSLRYLDRNDDVDATRTYTEAWVDYHAAVVAATRADEVAAVLTNR